jgi:hypothetical protein
MFAALIDAGLEPSHYGKWSSFPEPEKLVKQLLTDRQIEALLFVLKGVVSTGHTKSTTDCARNLLRAILPDEGCHAFMYPALDVLVEAGFKVEEDDKLSLDGIYHAALDARLNQAPTLRRLLPSRMNCHDGDRFVIVKDATKGHVHLFPRHTIEYGAATCMRFSPDGRYLAVGLNTDLRTPVGVIFDTNTKVSAYLVFKFTSIIQSLCFNQKSSLLVTGHCRGRLGIWDVATARLMLPLECYGSRDAICGIAISPGGSKLVSASSNGTIRLLDAKSGAALRPWCLETNEVPAALAFSVDGEFLAATSTKLCKYVWWPAISSGHCEPSDTIEHLKKVSGDPTQEHQHGDVLGLWGLAAYGSTLGAKAVRCHTSGKLIADDQSKDATQLPEVEMRVIPASSPAGVWIAISNGGGAVQLRSTEDSEKEFIMHGHFGKGTKLRIGIG